VSLPILLNGALGKMGTAIGALVLDDPAFQLTAAVECSGHPCLGKDYGTCIGKDACGVNVTDTLTIAGPAKAVAIDFSSPQSTGNLLKLVGSEKIPLVIGTTGLTENILFAVRKAARRMPVLISPNMSMGVNLLFALTELVSRRLKNDFDVEIIEAHHRFKKDAPSGTARRLGEIVAETFGLSYGRMVRNGRSGVTTARRKNEIGIHAVRGGDIVGDHTVLFAGMGERVELRHMAHSRTPLARGALTAAKWIATRRPGMYSMKDILGI
jgi:4-hydroxy-tetrahydrodipicolinate reductase